MDDLLTEKDWPRIQNALHGRDFKWRAIGIQLNISHAELTRIHREYGDNVEQCNWEMQVAWLKTGKATLGALVRALTSAAVGLHEDARRIQEKYIDHGEDGDSSSGEHSSQPSHTGTIIL